MNTDTGQTLLDLDIWLEKRAEEIRNHRGFYQGYLRYRRMFSDTQNLSESDKQYLREAEKKIEQWHREGIL